jgi:two-component system response regulator AtoC
MVDPGLVEALQGREWAGNVRQLRNLLQQAVLFEEQGVLRAETLLPVARHMEPPVPEVVSFGPDSEGADLSIKRHSARLEAHLIALALARTGGNRTQAARLLDISYKALAYKVKDYGLDKK